MFVEIISLFVDDQGSLYLILSTLSALQTSIIASSPVSIEMGVCLCPLELQQTKVCEDFPEKAFTFKTLRHYAKHAPKHSK